MASKIKNEKIRYEFSTDMLSLLDKYPAQIESTLTFSEKEETPRLVNGAPESTENLAVVEYYDSFKRDGTPKNTPSLISPSYRVYAPLPNFGAPSSARYQFGFAQPKADATLCEEINRIFESRFPNHNVGGVIKVHSSLGDHLSIGELRELTKPQIISLVESLEPYKLKKYFEG